tara:strand:+ start:123 stop:317 length:195 start_codon:yes stop_codon:yes gene_type:complete
MVVVVEQTQIQHLVVVEEVALVVLVEMLVSVAKQETEEMEFLLQLMAHQQQEQVEVVLLQAMLH